MFLLHGALKIVYQIYHSKQEKEKKIKVFYRDDLWFPEVSEHVVTDAQVWWTNLAQHALCSLLGGKSIPGLSVWSGLLSLLSLWLGSLD